MDFAAHFVEIAIVLFVAYVGYALGKSDLRIDPVLTAVTVVVAIILHGVWQLALPHGALEWIARAVARSPQSLPLVQIALVETAGIWIPVLVFHWAAPRTRLWAAAYIIGAATIGAFAYYLPSFDPRSEPHPEYEVWLVLALVVATVPFATGCIVKRRQRTVASLATPHTATDGH
jgi:membrane protease YdiL (CAAX protease family)